MDDSPARAPDLSGRQAAWVREIETLSEQTLLACYQCGRCSAGCPMVGEMDLLPNQVIRLAQLGMHSVLELAGRLGVRCLPDLPRPLS